MSYLIDSDWVADFLAGRQPAIGLVRTLLPNGLAMSVVSYIEIVEGIRGSRNRQALEQGFRQLLQGVDVLDLNRAIADRAADIRLDLRRQKRQINERAMDLLIAATAVELGLQLATRNTRHFADIPGLQLYEST